MKNRCALLRSLPCLVAVCLPALPASGQVMTQISCAGRTIRVTLPGDPLPPKQDQACCKGLCHSGSDRRKRGDGRPGC